MQTDSTSRVDAACTPRFTRRLSIVLVSLGLSCGCAGADSPATTEAQIDRIRALIGDAACDSDDQCRTVPVGAKACGGPEYYLAWSTKRTDPSAFRDASAGSLPPPARRSPGMKSDCMLVADPGAYCASSDSPNAAGGKACRLRVTRRGRVD